MFHKITFILLTIFISSISLADDDVLIIKNIKISSSNKNASIARSEALEKGQIKAFQELVKLYYPNAVKKVSNFTDADIFNTVEGFKLSKEQRSSTNYFAQITVKFSKSQVEKLMDNFGGYVFSKHSNQDEKNENENEIDNKPADIATPTMDTLVIPIFEENGNNYWFDNENKWLSFWQEKLKHNSSNQFTLPIGDLEDISLLNENILNKNLIDLTSLYEKYSINNIALLRLKAQDNGEVGQEFSLSIDYINRFSHSWQHYTSPKTDQSDLDQSMQQYYQETLKFNFRATEDFANSLATTKPQTIIVDFPIEHTSDWTTLEQILSNSKYVTNINLERINSKYYRFSLTYIVEFEELNEILNSYRLILQDEYNGRYALIKGE